MGVSRRVQGVRTGTIVMYAHVAGEPGYLRCNGDLYNIADKPRLFAKIGATYGGDGVTTFRVPEIRGEGIRGLDEGRGVDVGRVLGSWQDGQLGRHTHTIPTGGSEGDNNTVTNGWGPDVGPVTTDAAGGTSNGGENRMRNMAFPFSIKD